jgi:diadenylate cyclase
MDTLKDFVFSVTAANLVDIGIIACLIYFLLAWFAWTRAVQILVTLMGMGLLYFAAVRTGMVLTSWLFQYLWAAIIIVLVIVFQPEIREMLDRASPIRFLRSSPRKDLERNYIREIVKAVAELARLRIGALIVFQRVDGLDNIIIKGRDLESLVSAEAIVMIFQKNSPLHDGAILIRRERIKAASCILPLSSDESLSSRYGTRHRAALGLTERSDALCVVVSEERGEVSIVENKEITNYRHKEEFRETLQRGIELWKPQSEKTQWSFRDFVKKNWRLRLLSLVTALLLWFIIVGPQRSELGMSVPIQYTNLPPKMEITGKWMDRLDVRVRGSEAGLANLKPGSVRAVVNLSNVVTGLNFFRISDKNVLVPPGIAIAKIRPSDLQLNIEAASVKKMKVIYNILGPPPEKSLQITVIPAEVRVRALEADLQKVQTVTTEPVMITSLIEKGKVLVPVTIKPDGLRIDSIDPERVTISVEERKP